MSSKDARGTLRHSPTGLKDVDVVMMLRIQKERMGQADSPVRISVFRAIWADSGTLSHARAGCHCHAPAAYEPGD